MKDPFLMVLSKITKRYWKLWDWCWGLCKTQSKLFSELSRNVMLYSDLLIYNKKSKPEGRRKARGELTNKIGLWWSFENFVIFQHSDRLTDSYFRTYNDYIHIILWCLPYLSMSVQIIWIWKWKQNVWQKPCHTWI